MAQQQKIFKQCPMCKTVWPERKQFLGDISLNIEGYQVNFEDLGKGLFYFTHHTNGCNTTMTIEASEFFDLNPGRRYIIRNTLKNDCPRYCLKKNFLDQCSAKCDCAFVRDVIAIIKKGRGDKMPIT